MKPITNNEKFVDILFPVHGINVACEIEQQPEQTTPIGENVRACEPGTQRLRGGARPGLSKYLPQLPSGPTKVQHLNIVVDPTTDALLGNNDTNRTGGGGFVLDPSTNNLSFRNPGRFVRSGGSGAAISRRVPKIQLTITANDIEKSSGEEFVFDGSEFTVVGLQAGDVVTHVDFFSNGSAASATGGPFTIFATNATGTVSNGGAINQKYNITYIVGEMTIGGIEFVQTNYERIGFGPSDGDVTFDDDVSDGNLLVVAVSGFGHFPGAVLTVTDDLGNFYTQLVLDPGPNDTTSIHYCICNGSGPNTVNVNWNGQMSDYVSICILEYSGTNPTTPADATSVNDGNFSGLTWTTGAIPVAGNGELLVAVFGSGFQDLVVTVPAGLNTRANDFTDINNFEGFCVVDKLGVNSSDSAGDRNPTVTADADVPWDASGASFK